MAEDNIIFKRKIYERMLQWKTEQNGETALLIQGARRIGKSTIVKEFAQNEYKSFILIDFTKVSKEVNALFEDLSDLDYIFVRLQLAYKVTLEKRKSVIIFDEVQMQPLARQAIKHLVADGRYDYIETGSLISVKKNVENIVIPSEEYKLNMYPMDYEEFCWAMNDTTTVPLLKQLFDKREPLGDAIHRRVMRYFRLYMLVGGMPQAVSKYIATNNLMEADKVKRKILALYKEDMMKLDESGKTSALFDAIPSQLSKGASRYQVSSVLPNEKNDRVLTHIFNMADSMAVNVAYHCNDPNVGLALTKDAGRYKMYLGDTGLFITQIFMDKEFTDATIYEKLLTDKLCTNLGYVYENVVAQMLKACGKELYYHAIKKDDGKSYYEIDFVLTSQNKLVPLEIKSSGYKSHSSIDRFCQKYHDRTLQKVIIYTKDLKMEYGTLYLPVYMTMFL